MYGLFQVQKFITDFFPLFWGHIPLFVYMYYDFFETEYFRSCNVATLETRSHSSQFAIVSICYCCSLLVS